MMGVRGASVPPARTQAPGLLLPPAAPPGPVPSTTPTRAPSPAAGCGPADRTASWAATSAGRAKRSRRNSEAAARTCWAEALVVYEQLPGAEGVALRERLTVRLSGERAGSEAG
ncbi:hypothetical protein GCM10018785_50050 [Streptomyces longispororuber]|uniref:Uncharacterized protein n=1 Tax=Streptomyces longispororuber TaxID=68230 RepID=A0A919DTN4_9ACTN|nr:hypothetical protein GCM10018785_50050 [Streptomyces longispororuber]